MSIHAINWALQVSGSPTHKHVLLVLANFANHEGYAYPSIRCLARYTGLSERSISRAKAALRAQKYLIDAPDYRPGAVRLMLEAPQEPSDSVSSDTVSAPSDRVASPSDSLSRPYKNRHYPIETPPLSLAGARLSETWNANETLRTYAKERGLDPDRQIEDFRDYWHSATGPKAMKCDWAAAFRSWCRRSVDFHQRRSSPRGASSPRRSSTENHRSWLIKAAHAKHAAKEKRASLS